MNSLDNFLLHQASWDSKKKAFISSYLTMRGNTGVRIYVFPENLNPKQTWTASTGRWTYFIESNLQPLCRPTSFWRIMYLIHEGVLRSSRPDQENELETWKGHGIHIFKRQFNSLGTPFRKHFPGEKNIVFGYWNIDFGKSRSA